MSKYLYLIVGPSGSGKTTLADKLEAHSGMKAVASYTTRPKRTPDEKGHVFIDQEFFDKLDLVAYTKYNGYDYGVTEELLDIADLYVIDPAGVFDLLGKYHKREMRVIWLNASCNACRDRMVSRGDNPIAMTNRLQDDRASFSSYQSFRVMHSCPGIWINTDHKTPTEVMYEAWAYIESMEQGKVVTKNTHVFGMWDKIKEWF